MRTTESSLGANCEFDRQVCRQCAGGMSPSRTEMKISTQKVRLDADKSAHVRICGNSGPTRTRRDSAQRCEVWTSWPDARPVRFSRFSRFSDGFGNRDFSGENAQKYGLDGFDRFVLRRGKPNERKVVIACHELEPGNRKRHLSPALSPRGGEGEEWANGWFRIQRASFCFRNSPPEAVRTKVKTCEIAPFVGYIFRTGFHNSLRWEIVVAMRE